MSHKYKEVFQDQTASHQVAAVKMERAGERDRERGISFTLKSHKPQPELCKPCLYYHLMWKHASKNMS